MEREFVEPAPAIQAFVQQLLYAGGMLSNLVETLVEALVANGSPEDEATGDLIVTFMGTIGVRLASIPDADFARAAELLELAAEAVVADVRRAERHARTP